MPPSPDRAKFQKRVLFPLRQEEKKCIETCMPPASNQIILKPIAIRIRGKS